MRFFDLVEQDDAMRMLHDGIRQQAAFIITDIAWRRTDQARHRMPFHVFRHIKPVQLDAENRGQLARHFGFADAGRASEQVGADGLVRFAQTRTGQFDGTCQRVDRFVLAIDHAFEIGFQRFDRLRVIFRHLFGRDARNLSDDGFDLFHANRLATFAFRYQPLRSAGFVDHVNRFVRQFAVGHISGRQLNSGADGVIGIAEAMKVFESRLETRQDFHGVFDVRLDDINLAKAARQGAVFFKMLLVLFEGRRAHAADFAILKRRFQQV